ncbi:hypothetical protein CALVIDRAFT_566976 [Calocera viscosa TUFC12733]|uniref:Yeast cell wall synthesis Kre9/Knh1-like N-terminal domain-containing protein n=1 Tax=Calocera viscosa (strain TUFC12733) TaxID=1330018 RepID=A0A167IQX3_CALVF|nr:hypothetical protein CALVIDRAFT_566976 [Calocera viscosa TUFC12733]
MLALLLLSLLPAALGIIVPTTPDSSGVYPSGTNCPIAWTQDTTGVWDSFTIELMTGPNNPMVSLEVVASGLDGTDAGIASFSYPCPTVDINAPIYFYQFTQPGVSNITWTTRFTIASASGSTVAAPDPADSVTPAPWGTGSLTGASASSATSAGAAGAGAGAGTQTAANGADGAASTPATSSPAAVGGGSNNGAAGGAAATTAVGNGTPPGAAPAGSTSTGSFVPYSPGETQSAAGSNTPANSAARAEMVLGWSDWALIAAAGWVGLVIM